MSPVSDAVSKGGRGRVMDRIHAITPLTRVMQYLLSTQCHMSLIKNFSEKILNLCHTTEF